MLELTIETLMQHDQNCKMAIAHDRDINQLCEVRWFIG